MDVVLSCFMYSGETISSTKKKSMISNAINFAPLSASELTLYRRFRRRGQIKYLDALNLVLESVPDLKPLLVLVMP